MQPAPPASLSETLTPRQRWLLLISLMMSMFMGALDQTIMATAAPKVVASLGSFHLLSWVFTTSMLTSTVVVPLVGKLSDIFGRKVFLMLGMCIFMTAAAGCGLAPNMLALIICRGIQGIGGGIIFSSVFATVGDIFSPAERGKYMGLFTGTFSLASLLGPTIGGLLTDTVGWRWVFSINIPVGLMALTAIMRNLPAAPRRRGARIDFIGAALLSVAITTGLLALAWSGKKNGWGSTTTVSLFVTSLVSLAVFIAQELRHPEPILPLHLFREREFLLGNLIVLSAGVAMQGSVPYLPTFLQVGLDASAATSGLLTTPQSMGLLLTSIVGGQYLSRTGKYKRLVATGLCLQIVAFSLLLTLVPHTPVWHLSAFVVVLGLGGGMAMPTMSVVIQNAVSHRYLGVATSSRQFFMQIGGVMGTAIFGVLLTSSFQSHFLSDVAAETRAALPAATLERFEDPTLSLDKKAYASATEAVLATANGEQHLANAREAQRTAISTAIHRIFSVSIVVLCGTVVLALLMKERPLRRTAAVSEPAPARPAEQPAAASAALSGN